MPIIESKLSAAIIDECYRRHMRGDGYGALKKWILKEHNIDVSVTAIARKIKRKVQDNYGISRELLKEKREALGIAIDRDLALINDEINDVLRLKAEYTKKKDGNMQLRCTDRLTKLIELSRRYAGVNPEKEAQKTDTTNPIVMQRLDDLLKARFEPKESEVNSSEIEESIETPLTDELKNQKLILLKLKNQLKLH